MKRIFYLLIMIAGLAVTITSCTSDEPQIENPSGSVITTENGDVSRFYLANETDTDLSEDTRAEFMVIDPKTETNYFFSGNVRSIKDKLVDGQRNALECDMLLGENRIPDGYYYISVLIEGELRYGPFYVSVAENAITPVKGAAQYSYTKLKGEGSKENPYKISNFEDLEYFLTSLKEDFNGGYGQFFELTEDINLKSYTDNPKLSGATFQGTLNGNGHSLHNLCFDGRGQLSVEGGGLFQRLFNAEIYDLSLNEVALSGLRPSGGALSAEAKGRTVVRDVNVEGSIQGELNIGGLIGLVEGELHISGVSVNVSLSGGDRTGGIIGVLSHQGSSSSEFNNIKIDGKITGAQYTGGIIGLLKGTKSPKLGNLTVSSYIKGTEYVGGFIGMADKCSIDVTGDCTFDGLRMHGYSIEGKTNVGGVVGYIDLNESGNLNLDSHNINLNVAVYSTQGNVGGVAGFAKNGHIRVHKVNFDPENSMVFSDGNCVGGLIGRMEGSYIKAGNSINTKKELPKPSSYSHAFALKVRGVDYVGGCIGYSKWTLWGDPLMSRGSATGLVSKAEVTSIGEIAGGVAGWYEGDMSDCVFIGKVQGPSNGIIGGIIGKAQTLLDMYRCVNYSEITGGKYQGGICGYSNPAKGSDDIEWFTDYTDCYNIGNLKDGLTVGGIVGYGGQHNGGCSIRIRQCENYGEIIASGNADHSVGGLIGDLDSDKAIVEWSANYANIGSKKVQFTIGGVVGKIGRSQVQQNDVHVTGCTNLGTITCDDYATKIGGIVGHMMYGGSAIVAGNVNWGSIPGDQKSDTGGILGCATSFNYIHRNWNRGTVSHGNAIVGTHPGGTTFDHYGNYYLEGSGGSWPDAIMITKDQMTHASNFPDLTWGPNQDYMGYTGEWFQMSTEGPVTMSFDFIHWDVARLRPAGWHVER